MNFRLTATLLVVLFLIVGTVLLLTSFYHPGATSSSNIYLVFNPLPTQLSELVFREGDQVRLAFSAENGKWQMVHPVQGKVNAWDMEVLVNLFKELSYKEKFTAEPTGSKSLHTTGLDKPLYTISFTDNKQNKYKLFLGKRNAGGYVYAQVDGSAKDLVYVLATNPLEKLDKDSSDFRSKDLFDRGTDRVVSITLQRAKQTLKLAASSKGDKDQWMVQLPIPCRGNNIVAENMVSTLRSLQADSFVTLTRADAATGLAKPVLTVSVELLPNMLGSTQPTTLPSKTFAVQFGNYSDLSRKTIYAAVVGSEEVVQVSAEAFDKINMQLNDLRDPVILPQPITEAIEINLNQKLQLTKSGPTWKIQELSSKKVWNADTAEVTKFLESLRDLRANKFADGAGNLASLGLIPPHATLTITLPSGTVETLKIGTTDPAVPQTPLQRAGEDTVYLVANTDVAKLNIGLSTLRDKTVASFTPAQISKLSLSGAGVKFPLTITKENTKIGGIQWTATINANKINLDEVLMSGLLSDLQPLTAQKWLSEVKKDGLPPIAVLSFEAVSNRSEQQGPIPPQTYWLKLFHTQDGGYEAEFTGVNTDENWLFQPSNTLVEHLTKVDYRPTSATQPINATK